MCQVPFPGQWVKGEGHMCHSNFCGQGRGYPSRSLIYNFLLGFLAIIRRTHGRNGVKFDMQVYHDHIPTWFDFVPLMAEKLNEIGISGILRRTHVRNCPKFGMPVYHDHLQKRWEFGHRLVIFLLFLVHFWHSKMDQIWGFQKYFGEKGERRHIFDSLYWVLSSFSLVLGQLIVPSPMPF